MACLSCPRHCAVDRSRQRGFCGAPAELQVSAVCLHRGEEPVLTGASAGSAPSGIVNIFFSHCSLQCIYCQNAAIAGHDVDDALVHYRSVDAVADRVAELLPQSSGVVGLVTAAHYVDYVVPLVEAIHRRGFHPAVVYNSSGYEDVDALRSLEGIVDIYLPDFKYMDPRLAEVCSHAADYPQVATQAIAEMYRQVGSGLLTDDGIAFRGMIIRHLVLPGHVDNSLACLDWIADHLPSNIHLSLMAQYFPPDGIALPAPLDRTLTDDEYKTVVDHCNRLGFSRGWLQEMSSQHYYRPDFTNPVNPFEA